MKKEKPNSREGDGERRKIMKSVWEVATLPRQTERRGTGVSLKKRNQGRGEKL